MKQYRAVVFDLFSTIALWRPDRLPLFEWRGKSTHSTMGRLRDTVESIVLDASFESFVDALDRANEELAQRRRDEMIEFTSNYRFTLALTKAGYKNNEDTRRVAESLSLKHMELLASAVEVPTAHTDLLETLSPHFALALISNFDHSETAMSILRRDATDRHLEPIVISDAHGWRKPHPKIFDDTLAELAVDAGDTLYVGDSPTDDVVGAKGAGLDVAWVNARAAPMPPGLPNPDYEIREIPELAELLLQ